MVERNLKCKKMYKARKNIVKSEYYKFKIHLKFVALYKLWSKTYKMFWQWNHQNLQLANGLLHKLLYLLSPIILSMFMCSRSCLWAKYLWKVLKTTSSLKWVWKGWNFATSNCIQGGRLFLLLKPSCYVDCLSNIGLSN